MTKVLYYGNTFMKYRKLNKPYKTFRKKIVRSCWFDV